MKSPARSAHPIRNTPSNKSCGLSLRIIAPSIELSIFSVSSGSENVHARSLVLSMRDLNANVRIPSLNKDASPPTQLALKLGSITLAEVDSASIFPIVYFGDFANNENKDVFPSGGRENGNAPKKHQAGGISITDDVDFELLAEFSNDKKKPDEKAEVKVVSSPDVSLSFRLNPIVAIISPELILRWVDEMGPLMANDNAEPSSSFKVVVDLPAANFIICPNLPSVDTMVQPNPNAALRAIGVLNDSFNLNRGLKYNRWMVRGAPLSRKAQSSFSLLKLKSHINTNVPISCQHDIFFRVCLLDVRVRLNSNLTNADIGGCSIPTPIIEMKELNVYLRLEADLGMEGSQCGQLNELTAFELKFVSSISSSDRKISVRKFLETDFSADSSVCSSKLPAILRSRMSRKEYSKTAASDQPADSSAFKAAAGPLPPPLHGGEIFVLDAHLIRLGL